MTSVQPRVVATCSGVLSLVRALVFGARGLQNAHRFERVGLSLALRARAGSEHGGEERRRAVSERKVDECAVLQQVLHHRDVCSDRGAHQRRCADRQHAHVGAAIARQTWSAPADAVSAARSRWRRARRAFR